MKLLISVFAVVGFSTVLSLLFAAVLDRREPKRRVDPDLWTHRGGHWRA